MATTNIDQRDYIAGLDAEVGARLRAARERVAYSQQIVTVHLALYGIDWHQTTVGKVESGERPVRLTELVALANVLGTPLDALVYGSSHTLERERIAGALKYLDDFTARAMTERARLDARLGELFGEAETDGER